MSSYDQNLLGEAPKATRAQLQQGYSVDLLEQPAEPPRRTPSVRSPTPHVTPSGPAAIAVPLTPAIAENSSKEKLDSPAPLPLSAPKSKVPFWRTRNGIIIITILALVVVGAVVGGAVGGTVGNKSSNNANAVKSSSSSSLATPTTTSTSTSSSVSATQQAVSGGEGGGVPGGKGGQTISINTVATATATAANTNSSQ